MGLVVGGMQGARRGVVLPAVALLLALGACPVSSAQSGKAGVDAKPDLMSMSVEELMAVEVARVVGASKHEQQVTEAPASVSIVTADDIKRYGYRTLADALRSVRGIYVTYDRNYNYLGVRGFNRPGDLDTRILLLVDGHRINDNIYQSAPIGTEFPLDVDLIDRIEVIRGPSSSLYGTNAFFGVVNVITKRPAELQGAGVAAAAGTLDTYNGRVSYGKDYRSGLGLLLSASVLRSGGNDRLFFKEFDTQGNNHGIAQDADADRNYQLFGKFSYRDFTLTAASASREKTIPTASYGTVFNDPGTNTTDGHSFLDLKYSHLFRGETQLTLRLFYDRYLYDGDYIYDRTDSGGPAAVLNKDQAWGHWWGSEAEVSRTLWGRHKVTAGAEYRNNSLQQQKNYDVAPRVQYLDIEGGSHHWALYLQDEIRLLDSLILSAGVRYDHYDSFGGTANPRLGLIYQPLEGTVFKLLYGRAFRAPNAYEFFYDDGQTSKANPQLQPERIETYEAIYEQYFLKHYRSSVSAFYYRIDDLISQVTGGDGMAQFVNSGAIDAKGGELELEGTWGGGLRGRLSYTFQRAEDARSGAILTNSPRHLAKLNVVLPLVAERLFLGFEEQFMSSRTTLAGSRTGDVFLSNATVSCRTPIPGLEASLSVYNLLDARYGDPGAGPPQHLQDTIQQDGRAFRGKLEYRF